MKNVEIEIQVQVENSKPLRAFLETKAEATGASRQIDQYFTPVHRNFIAVKPVAEWLRVRDAEGRYSLNYKNWHYTENGKSTHCDEYETKVENLEQLQLILKALNLKPLVTVDKQRATYRYKEYEIALDHVEGLGDFVEVEYKGTNNENPTEITDQMVTFLKDLGVGKMYRNYVGYPFQLLFPDNVRLEEY